MVNIVGLSPAFFITQCKILTRLNFPDAPLTSKQTQYKTFHLEELTVVILGSILDPELLTGVGVSSLFTTHPAEPLFGPDPRGEGGAE